MVKSDDRAFVLFVAFGVAAACVVIALGAFVVLVNSNAWGWGVVVLGWVWLAALTFLARQYRRGKS
jgi:hypothetical protein